MLCFWESNVVRNMSLGNMRAHRRRNRISAMMFTLAMGLVVFIMIVLDIQYSSFITSKNREDAMRKMQRRGKKKAREEERRKSTVRT